MLAAGLEGIEKGYQVPPPAEEDVYLMSAEKRQSLGIGQLPGSLWEAIQLAEGGTVVRGALGEHVFTSVVENKKIEWERYRSQVTDYEIRRYLPIL